MIDKLQNKIYESCIDFETLEYWFEKFKKGEASIEIVSKSIKRLKESLGMAVGLTDYLARFDWSIEPEKKGER